MKATAQTSEVVDLSTSTVDTVPAGETPAPLALSAPADPDPVVEAPKRGRGRPPKDRSADAPASKSAGGRPSNSERLAKSLTDQYVVLGQIVALFAPRTGETILERSGDCASSLASWSETNPKVRKALERVNNGAGFAAVLIAHAPIAFAAYAELSAPRSPSPATTSNPNDSDDPLGAWTAVQFGS